MNHALGHHPRRHIPRLRAARLGSRHSQAQRNPGRGSADPDTWRGNYCPKEHQQHRELAANYPKIAVSYTKIATISTDSHHSRQEFRASVGAQWPFLEDPDRIVPKDLDIQEYTDTEHDPMIPHTLALKPGLVICRRPGSVIVLPGGTAHFHWARSGEYVSQVTAIGPLGLEYVNPSDDPRAA